MLCFGQIQTWRRRSWQRQGPTSKLWVEVECVSLSLPVWILLDYLPVSLNQKKIAGPSTTSPIVWPCYAWKLLACFTISYSLCQSIFLPPFPALYTFLSQPLSLSCHSSLSMSFLFCIWQGGGDSGQGCFQPVPADDGPLCWQARRCQRRLSLQSAQSADERREVSEASFFTTSTRNKLRRNKSQSWQPQRFGKTQDALSSR